MNSDELIAKLEDVSHYKQRIASAEGIYALNQQSRISSAAEQGQGLVVQNFASTPRQEFRLDATDIQQLAQDGLPRFRNTVSKEAESLETELLNFLMDNKHESAIILLQIRAQERKYPGPIKELALEYLVGKLGSEVVDDIIPFLKDRDEFLRYHAAHILLKIESPQSIDPLVLALQDTDVDVRRVATIALGTFGNDRAIDPITKLLESESDARVRQAAQLALKELRKREKSVGLPSEAEHRAVDGRKERITQIDQEISLLDQEIARLTNELPKMPNAIFTVLVILGGFVCVAIGLPPENIGWLILLGALLIIAGIVLLVKRNKLFREVYKPAFAETEKRKQRLTQLIQEKQYLKQ